jgi:hypothetical protein
VAFKYKVHVDEANFKSHTPILLKTAWKSTGDKLGLVIEYCLNPEFASNGPVTVNNLLLLANYEGAKAGSCQTKPSGTHIKEKSLVYWRLGDVTLDGSWQRIIARLTGADGQEPKPGFIEARWEINVTTGAAIGSGLGISRLEMGKGKEKEEADPFADDSVSTPTTSTEDGNKWIPIEAARKVISGKFEAR